MDVGAPNVLLHSLHTLLSVLTYFGMTVAFLMRICDFSLGQIWQPLSALIFGFSFIIGGALKSTFDSIIFIFFMHPFDVGDTVEIEGQQYIATEISLMSTTFR